jgi:hypothetical protein
MAYTLLEAGRLWKSPEYTHLGRGMLSMIAKAETANLPGFGLALMPGPGGFQHGQTWTLNPSYTPVFLFERFAHLDPPGPWRQVALNLPRLLDGSSRHGFAMDWVNYIPGDGFTPAPPMQTGNKDSEVAGRKLRRHSRLSMGGDDGCARQVASRRSECDSGHEQLPRQS